MKWKALHYLRWHDPFRALRKGGAVCLALSFGSLIMMGDALPDLSKVWHLSRNGMETNGTVLRHYTNGTSGKGNRFWVEYQFEAQGRNTGSAPVSESEWVAYRPGRPIAVWYLPDDPDNHSISPGGALWQTLIFCLLGAFFLSCAILGTLAILVRTIRQAYLRSVGLPMTATITRIASSGRSSFISQSWIMIWKDETGRQGRSDPRTAWFHSREPLPIGTTITIYADPKGRLPSVWEGDCGARCGVGDLERLR